MIKYCRAIYILLKSIIILTRYTYIPKNQSQNMWIRLWITLCGGHKKREGLASVIQKMGPTYIKIGQFFATRRDIIPEHIAQQLINMRYHKMVFL